MSINNKPNQAMAQQQTAATIAQMQAAAAQQQNAFMQQQANSQLGSHLSMQQMQSAFNQMMAQGSHQQKLDSKYSSAELKMAIGTTIYVYNNKFTLKRLLVDDMVEVFSGKIFKSYLNIPTWYITKVPLVDDIYKTKMGHICKS